MMLRMVWRLMDREDRIDEIVLLSKPLVDVSRVWIAVVLVIGRNALGFVDILYIRG